MCVCVEHNGQHERQWQKRCCQNIYDMAARMAAHREREGAHSLTQSLPHTPLTHSHTHTLLTCVRLLCSSGHYPSAKDTAQATKLICLRCFRRRDPTNIIPTTLSHLPLSLSLSLLHVPTTLSSLSPFLGHIVM